MQIIESGMIRTLIPEKGYKLVNKKTGKTYSKLMLGVRDSVDNYTEIVDEKYVNMDFVVEFDEFKSNVTTNEKDVNESIDIILMSIDRLFELFSPLLVDTMSMENVKDPLFNIYVALVQRELKDINDIPEKYKNDVKNKLGI